MYYYYFSTALPTAHTMLGKGMILPDGNNKRFKQEAWKHSSYFKLAHEKKDSSQNPNSWGTAALQSCLGDLREPSLTLHQRPSKELNYHNPGSLSSSYRSHHPLGLPAPLSPLKKKAALKDSLPYTSRIGWETPHWALELRKVGFATPGCTKPGRGAGLQGPAGPGRVTEEEATASPGRTRPGKRPGPAAAPCGRLRGVRAAPLRSRSKTCSSSDCNAAPPSHTLPIT